MANVSVEQGVLGELLTLARNQGINKVKLDHSLTFRALQNVKLVSGQRLYYQGVRTDVEIGSRPYAGPFTVVCFGYIRRKFTPEEARWAKQPDYFVLLGCGESVAQILEYVDDGDFELTLRAANCKSNLDPCFVATACGR